MSEKDLRQAILLVKNGSKRTGGAILADIVKDEPQNEMAWLWLSVCVGSNEQKKACLRKALEINPDNKNTQYMLSQLDLIIEPPSFSDIIGNLPSTDKNILLSKTSIDQTDTLSMLPDSKEAVEETGVDRVVETMEIITDNFTAIDEVQEPMAEKGQENAPEGHSQTDEALSSVEDEIAEPTFSDQSSTSDESLAEITIDYQEEPSFQSPVEAESETVTVASPDNDIPFLLEQAKAFETNHQFEEAVQVFSQIIDLDSNHASAWLGKGRSTAWLSIPGWQRIEEGITCIENALAAGVEDGEEFRKTGEELSSATLAYTQEWINVYTGEYKGENSNKKSNPIAWATGSAKKKNQEYLTEKLSEQFWQDKMPILNGLWLSWWSLDGQIETAQNVYGVIKCLKNSAIDPGYQDAFIQSINPILFDIKAKFPSFKPPVKVMITPVDPSEYSQSMVMDQPETSFVNYEEAPETEATLPVTTLDDLLPDEKPSPEETVVIKKEASQKQAVASSDKTVQFIPEKQKEPSQTAPSLAEKARVAEAGQQYQEAYDSYAAILRNDAGDMEAWVGMGRNAAMISTLNDPHLDEAVDCFKQALELGEPDKQTLVNMAGVLSYAARIYADDLLISLFGQAAQANKGSFFGKKSKGGKKLSADEIAEQFWNNQMPIINTLWFAWWGLSKEPYVADQVNAVINNIYDSDLDAEYQEAFVKTFEPILEDIKTTLPHYKPSAPGDWPLTQPVPSGQKTETQRQEAKPAVVKQESKAPHKDTGSQKVSKIATPIKQVSSPVVPPEKTPVEEAIEEIPTEEFEPYADDTPLTADLLEDNQQFQEAYSAYSLLLETDPNDASAWLGKGRCAAWLSTPEDQRLDESVTCIKNAFEIGIKDPQEITQSAISLGTAAFVYTRDLLFYLEQKHDMQILSSKRGSLGSILSTIKSKSNNASEKMSEEFWAASMPIFSSLFLCWRISNDTQTAGLIYDTINILKASGVANNYTEAFIETFNPIIGEIKGKFPKYKPPVKPRL